MTGHDSPESAVTMLRNTHLGGGIVKKRIGLAGRGKRGGARTLVATNKGNRWFFIFGFEKNERANIADDELAALQDIATVLLARTGRQLDEAFEEGSLPQSAHSAPRIRWRQLDEAFEEGSLQEICHDHNK